MIKEPLYHLSNFIKQNLTPNRLEGFNIEAIKDLKDFEMPQQTQPAHQVVLTQK
tara:strand:+ start:1575 stop:1736 length:162 start_codon:yes stop_codon:yes gene_type:complete